MSVLVASMYGLIIILELLVPTGRKRERRLGKHGYYWVTVPYPNSVVVLIATAGMLLAAALLQE